MFGTRRCRRTSSEVPGLVTSAIRFALIRKRPCAPISDRAITRNTQMGIDLPIHNLTGRTHASGPETQPPETTHPSQHQCDQRVELYFCCLLLSKIRWVKPDHWRQPNPMGTTRPCVQKHAIPYVLKRPVVLKSYSSSSVRT